MCGGEKMKINPNLGVDNIYESVIRKTASGNEEHMEIDSQNPAAQDRVEISDKAASYDDLQAFREQVIGDVEKGTSADRLRQLKADIESGNYSVSGRDIAEAILNRGRGI
jgi:anti-sigma28 factor (negative regulator of flagellin synthesis)